MSTPAPLPRTRGFTLIESLVTLMVLGTVSVAIIGLNGTLFLRANDMQRLQQSTQLLQACMEQVIGQRKSAGYAATLHCNELNALNTGITLSVAPAASVDACPSGMQCRQVEISADDGSITRKLTGLIFVNY